MKYRLLKPIDICVAGDIFEVQNAGNNCFPKRTWLDCRRTFFALPIELASDPDWFEEVKPWVPKDGEEFWYIDANLNPQKATDNIPMPEDTYETPLYPFRTEAEAESCAAALRMTLTAWKEAHP